MQYLIVKGYLIKQKNITGEINNNLVVESKGSGKIKKIGIFTDDICTRNQSGFFKSSPVNWAIDLDSYIENNKNTFCRWLHKTTTGSKCCSR